MADERLLPASIRDDRSQAFLALIERLAAIDLAPLLVYRIDSTSATALYALAWQFGVTGLAGWDLAATEEKRRGLVRRAIEFQRHKGTPWVIREALGAVGFPDIRILEHYGLIRYDGSETFDGGSSYSVAGVWADFAVIFGEPADGLGIGEERRELLQAIIETWKPARSRLVTMRFESYRYDAMHSYNGYMTYSGAAAA